MNKNDKDFEQEYDSLKDVTEFQNNMFNPGHYIGTGKVPPTISAPGNATPLAIFCFIASACFDAKLIYEVNFMKKILAVFLSFLLVFALTACNKGTKKTDSNNSKDAAQQQSSSSTFEESSKQESSTVNEFTWSASEVKGNTSSDFTVTEGDPRKSGIMAARNVMINQFNDTVANNTIACALVLPRGYDSSKKYPVFLYLHGVGVEGNDGERHLSLLSLMRSNAPEYLDEAILVAPQCPQGMHWQVHGERGEYTGALASVKRLIDKIAEEYSCDKSRYYAIGYSYGGYGVLSLVDNYSNYFAAVHVIAGWYNSSSVRNLANTSIWFHHGTADNIVSPENSKELYRALKEYGAKDVKISLYEGVEHDSYNDSLGNIDNYTWMFSKTK